MYNQTHISKFDELHKQIRTLTTERDAAIIREGNEKAAAQQYKTERDAALAACKQLTKAAKSLVVADKWFQQLTLEEHSGGVDSESLERARFDRDQQMRLLERRVEKASGEEER